MRLSLATAHSDTNQRRYHHHNATAWDASDLPAQSGVHRHPATPRPLPRTAKSTNVGPRRSNHATSCLCRRNRHLLCDKGHFGDATATNVVNAQALLARGAVNSTTAHAALPSLESCAIAPRPIVRCGVHGRDRPEPSVRLTHGRPSWRNDAPRHAPSWRWADHLPARARGVGDRPTGPPGPVQRAKTTSSTLFALLETHFLLSTWLCP